MRREPDNDANLVFDPDSRWFADVPLIRTTGGGGFQVVRGAVTKTEAGDVRNSTSRAAPGMTLGVFTNSLGDTSLYEPGHSFTDDPRDVAYFEAADLLAGTTLTALAQHLRDMADKLAAWAADGWVLWSIHAEGFAITDAPDRVEPDVSMAGGEPDPGAT
jgi:hypothetical protein